MRMWSRPKAEEEPQSAQGSRAAIKKGGLDTAKGTDQQSRNQTGRSLTTKGTEATEKKGQVFFVGPRKARKTRKENLCNARTIFWIVKQRPQLSSKLGPTQTKDADRGK
jgi:hypothetical protein